MSERARIIRARRKCTFYDINGHTFRILEDSYGTIWMYGVGSFGAIEHLVIDHATKLVVIAFLTESINSIKSRLQPISSVYGDTNSFTDLDNSMVVVDWPKGGELVTISVTNDIECEQGAAHMSWNQAEMLVRLLGGV